MRHAGPHQAVPHPQAVDPGEAQRPPRRCPASRLLAQELAHPLAQAVGRLRARLHGLAPRRGAPPAVHRLRRDEHHPSAPATPGSAPAGAGSPPGSPAGSGCRRPRPRAAPRPRAPGCRRRRGARAPRGGGPGRSAAGPGSPSAAARASPAAGSRPPATTSATPGSASRAADDVGPEVAGGPGDQHAAVPGVRSSPARARRHAADPSVSRWPGCELRRSRIAAALAAAPPGRRPHPAMSRVIGRSATAVDITTPVTVSPNFHSGRRIRSRSCTEETSTRSR